MSIPVDLDQLATALEEFGAAAYLLTTGDDHRPRVAHITVRLDAGVLHGEVGKRTAANAVARPAVSLLWPPAVRGGMSLIVDGDAAVAGTAVAVTPTWAVRHRPAPAPGPVADGACGADCAPLH
jgi:hypothetical protein